MLSVVSSRVARISSLILRSLALRSLDKEILHHLLGDSRGASAFFAARTHRLDQRADHAARVKAVMVIEILVLGADERLF